MALPPPEGTIAGMPRRDDLLPALAQPDPRRAQAVAFAYLAACAFLIRVVLAPWVAHMGDLGAFMGWGKRLATEGPAGFWNDDYWCDYLPGYLLILQAMGEIAIHLPAKLALFKVGSTTVSLPLHILLFKLPNLLADVVSAYLIWRLTREKTGRRHLWIPAAYLFNPAVLLNSTLWGQADSIHALGLLGGLYLLTQRRVLLSSLVLGYALAIKPHSLVLLPFALVYAIRQRMPWWRTVLAVVIVPLVFAGTFLPFTGWSVGALPEFIRDRYTATMGQYGYATVNSFNLWYLSGYNWVKDDTRIWPGLSIQQCAYLLCFTGLIAVLLRYLWQRRDRTSGLWEASALAYLVVFLFVTRAHERHVFPYFALLAVALAWRRAAWAPWLALSATYCVNLAFAWRYLVDPNRGTALCAPALGNALCAINLAVLPLTVIACHPLAERIALRVIRGYRLAEAPPPLPVWPWAERNRWRALAGIMFFALAARMIRLNDPPQRYFDEVYHAYTAQQWAKGNTDAWLWSTRAPDKGNAYEWTHPPLAKLAMQWSVQRFGNNPWAWRLPGALLGTLDVLLIYGLAATLFRHRGVALLAAALAALDVLPLFASRIGMNDVYCVTFILLALLLVLRERWAWFAPAAVGLALACKWTALYALPLLGFVHLLQGLQRARWPIGRHAALAALYLICVPTIYLASYAPFFRAGFSGGQFVELQKQMWFYHTGLTATHPYSSKAWQWPVLIKAVWCFTDKQTPPAEPSAAPAENASADGGGRDPRVALAGAAAQMQPAASPVKVKPPRKRPAGRASPTPSGPAGAAPPAQAAAERNRDAWAANVYAWGNPIIWCTGLAALLLALYEVTTTRNPPLLVAVAGYLAFWAPWLASPRIMFLYHYLPSLPFLYIVLAWAVARMRLQRGTIVGILVFATAAFLLIYPYVTAIYLPYSWTPVGRNG